MARLILAVALEILVALIVAGVLVAIVIPLMIQTELMHPGDAAGTIVVIGMVLIAVATALLRPGSAIHRHSQREK